MFRYYLCINFLENSYYLRSINSLTNLRISKEKINNYHDFNINNNRVGYTLYDILSILRISIY